VTASVRPEEIGSAKHSRRHLYLNPSGTPDGFFCYLDLRAMTRRDSVRMFGALLGFPVLAAACRIADGHSVIPMQDGLTRLRKSRKEWRTLLTAAEFSVLFDEATERPFSSPLDKEFRDGTYVCAACFLPLFTSDAKYDSSTGWPSFSHPIEGRIGRKRDWKLIIPRTEYHCIRCSGHQGHVFNDGPRPTGQRWCNNGIALRFVLRGDTLPALRT
jgi:peptide-methionine (R)-S-oxide reductase